MIDYKNLIQKALSALENAYVPYSNFRVGACVLTKSGKYFNGCNVENSSYGVTVCAERNAINNAIINGEKDIVAIAIVSSNKGYTFPCGICRQSMIEFNKDLQVVVAKSTDDYKVFKITELLPYYFSDEDLK